MAEQIKISELDDFGALPADNDVFPFTDISATETFKITRQDFLGVTGIVLGTDDTQTVTNKTFNLASNTLTGTTAEFNIALSDGSFATLAGAEALTNKTFNLASNTLTGTTAEFNTALSDANFYTTGGTDVALADGGTGASLADPNADRIMFWDDSAGAVTWLTAGTGLTITDTTLTAATAPGGSDTQVQFNDGGLFNGDAGLVYVKGTDTLTAGNMIVTTDLSVDTGNTDVGAFTASGAAVFDNTTTFNGNAFFTNTGLRVRDTNNTHNLIIAPGSNLTADHTFTITTGDADRTLTLGADSSISGTAYVVGGTDVAIADGGTGQSTATAAFDALAPTTTQGDLIYHDGTDNVRLPKGTASQVLTMNGGATAPEWTTAAGGGDFSSNTGTSVDSEIVLFSGTGGKTGKRATGSGIATLTSGVLSATATTGSTNVVLSDTPTIVTPTIVQINNSSAPGVKLQLNTQINNSNSITSATTAAVSLQMGWGQVEGDGTSKVEKAVTFPTAYSTILGVLPGALAANTSGSSATSITDLTVAVGSGPYTAFIDDVTTSGFNMNLLRSDAVTFSAGNWFAYSWIAWGVV